MVVIGISGSSYPMMREWFIEAFRFEIVEFDHDDMSSTLHEIGTRLSKGTRNIVVFDIKTLKEYRALKFYFGCVVIRVGSSSILIEPKIKHDYLISEAGNGGEIYKIVSDLM